MTDQGAAQEKKRLKELERKSNIRQLSLSDKPNLLDTVFA